MHRQRSTVSYSLKRRKQAHIDAAHIAISRCVSLPITSCKAQESSLRHTWAMITKSFPALSRDGVKAQTVHAMHAISEARSCMTNAVDIPLHALSKPWLCAQLYDHTIKTQLGRLLLRKQFIF